MRDEPEGIVIVPGTSHPDRCRVEAIHDVMEGVETSFTIKTYDKYGNNCQGGDEIEVQIVGADVIEVPIPHWPIQPGWVLGVEQ